MKLHVNSSVRLELEELRQRLQEAEETLDAIRNGKVDALVVSGPSGEKVFTLCANATSRPRLLWA
jgi:hypothetical protein